MTLQRIETEEQLKELVQKETFLLFKHSVTCNISADAFEEYQQFISEHDVPTAYLAVQEARPLSNYIAETYDIKHQSPQVIVFKNGQPTWNESHWRITHASLKENL